MTFTAIPAIDVREGRVVRLHQGDYALETAYGDSPLAVATRYAQDGARWLHLVDLDAARTGCYVLDNLMAAIRRDTGLAIQTGGGIRSDADVERLLASGATRVVIGTLAVRDPVLVSGWLQRYGGERLVVALDARQDEHGRWQLPVRGWTEASGSTLDELLATYADAGLRHLLCTDIDRDGTLAGFNIDLYRRLATQWPGLSLQASGGVRDVADVRAARDAGASAAILGRALLEGGIDLAEALAC